MNPELVRGMRRVVLIACAAWLGSTPPAAAAAPARLVDLDADDASLPAVLKILADKGGLNIVTGPGVAGGRLTIHLRQTPVDQAVNLVVRAAGLAYERIGNSILVAEAKDLKEETGLGSYVVNLRFADANEVKEALKGLSENIQVDRGGNRLIIVTSPRVISEIENIIAELDRPARQVMLEARIVEVSTDDAKRLGIDWNQLSRQQFIFVEGNYASAEGVGENGENLENIQVFPNTPGSGDVWKLKNFSRIGKVFRLALDALIRDGSGRILANPKLATLNGKEATMLVGQRIPFVVTGTVFAGGGAAPVSQVQKEEVGVKLGITPLINADGFITTVIRPEVSSVTGFKGANGDLPVVSTRQAQTTVRLKDGGSVIIGGLLSEETSNTITKVPLLGDIPGLGNLFRHVNNTQRKTDLVIEVTARILPEQP